MMNKSLDRILADHLGQLLQEYSQTANVNELRTFLKIMAKMLDEFYAVSVEDETHEN